MSDENKKERTADTRFYLIGLLWALGLSALAFGVVYMQLGRALALTIIGGTAVLQFIVQLRYFFHIDHSKQSREDLQLILFSLVLLIIMVGGTIWVLTSLNHRMVMAM